jgi:hypothetical protein
LQLINPSTLHNELNTTLTPHSMVHGDACFAYFNKIWGIPGSNGEWYYCIAVRQQNAFCRTYWNHHRTASAHVGHGGRGFEYCGIHGRSRIGEAAAPPDSSHEPGHTGWRRITTGGRYGS